MFAGNDITVCNNPGVFGNIGIGGTASVTFEFVISTTFTPCGGTIGFDVTTKTSTELTPAGADEPDVFSINVGQSGGGSSTTDEAGATGGVPDKSTSTYYTLNNPVTSTPGVLTACTVDIDLTVPCTGTGTVTVTIEHDPGNDGTYEYTQTVYNGAGTGWANVTGFSLSNMVDATDIGDGGWRIVIVHTKSGSPCTPDGTLNAWTLHLTTTGGWNCTYIGTGTCLPCSAPTGLPVRADL